MNSKIKNIAFTGLIAATICIISVWQIPLPFLAVPLTFQTFAVCLAGSVLGKWKGALATLVYITLGTVGLPVFSGFQGGVGIILGPLGGFILGFIPFAFFAGMGKRKKPFIRFLLCGAGLIICHLFGTLWYAFITGTQIGSAFLLASLPFIIKDLGSALLAVVLAGILEKRKII